MGVLTLLPLFAVAACTPANTESDSATPKQVLTSIEVPAPLDAAALGVQAVDESDPAVGLTLFTLPVPTAPDLETRSRGFIDSWRAAAQASGSALDVGFDVVGANRQVLALRYRASADQGASTGSEVFFTDLASGAVWSSAELLTPEGLAALGAAVTESSPEIVAGDLPGQALASDVRFDAAGDLVVVNTTPSGEVAWKAPRELVDGWLTQQGRIARGAMRSEGAFIGVNGPQQPAPVILADVPLPPPPAPPVPPPPAPGQSTGGPVDCTVAKCIALTFDDGPGAYTQQLLDILASKGVKATFYLVGKQVAAYPDTTRNIAAAGHAIGNHTWGHPNLPTLSSADRLQQINSTSQAIIDAIGHGPSTMRPPYGAADAATLADLASVGLPVILWDVDSEDWKNRDAAKTTERVMATSRAGSIVLMHDIHASTIQAVPGIIDQLAAQGYTFVTVDQMLGAMNPGQKYFSR